MVSNLQWSLFNIIRGQLVKARIRLTNDKAETSRKHDMEERQSWQKVWCKDIKKKLQNFLRKACHNRILVGVQLKKRGLIADDTCNICGEEFGTISIGLGNYLF